MTYKECELISGDYTYIKELYTDTWNSIVFFLDPKSLVSSNIAPLHDIKICKVTVIENYVATSDRDEDTTIKNIRLLDK